MQCSAVLSDVVYDSEKLRNITGEVYYGNIAANWNKSAEKDKILIFFGLK